MLWRVFRKSRPDSSPDAVWWREADRVADAPTPAAIESLRSASATAAPDDAERRGEMLEGLEDAARLDAGDALPVFETHHRVIGTDICHFVAPVTVGDSPVAGKLFLTNTRMVLAGAGAQTWAWHRLRAVIRSDRDVVFSIAGSDEGLAVRCNTYADALIITRMSTRLIPKKSGATGA